MELDYYTHDSGGNIMKYRTLNLRLATGLIALTLASTLFPTASNAQNTNQDSDVVLADDSYLAEPPNAGKTESGAWKGIMPSDEERAFSDIAPAAGQKNNSSGITAIIIEGNARVENSTITSFMNLAIGSSPSPSDISKALNNLYESGLFADVSIDIRERSLHVKVVENPIIADVVFEGNKRITDGDLSSEVRLAPRAIYSKSDLQHDVKRILNLYQKSGRFSANVVPKVIQLPQNRINLVFEIDEGDRTEIARIAFVGNRAFSSSKLNSLINTRESRWYRFLSSADTYDPDRIAFDKELLRRHYVADGFADFRVLSADAELTQDGKSFIITFSLDEGNRYNFGKIGVESRLPDVEGNELEGLLKSRSGDVFNANSVETSIESITEYLGNKGYAFVNVSPQYDRDPDNRQMGINYLIKEGPRVYIENINITGNLRTLDEVIRREFRIVEGDPYNAAKLKRSQQRIRNLGFFSNVQLAKERGSADDKVDVSVEIEEQSTGELTFGAGFSTSDGALGDISIVERNLLGKGQSLKLNFTLASVRQEVDLSFTEPYFMGRNVAAGFDLFSVKRDSSSSRDSRTFDNEAVGLVLRASYPVTEHLTHAMRYSLRSDNITGVSADASEFIKRQAGKNTTSLVGHSLIYDARDNRFEPSDGWYLRLNQDLAGLGGDTNFVRHEVRSAWYTPVFSLEDVTLKISGQAGYVFGYGGEDVRINDRFFIGGDDIRGFRNEGIGPRDELSLDPLGGNTYASATAELSFPVGLPEELGFKGALFTDIGTLFDNDESMAINDDGSISRVMDDASPRASVGVGLGWRSPVGPIRIDFSHAYMKETYDRTESIRFNFGTRF